jgi:hydroxymethylpyrimidine/phosphomethylpyrimidine kinase
VIRADPHKEIEKTACQNRNDEGLGCGVSAVVTCYMLQLLALKFMKQIYLLWPDVNN